MAVNGISLEHCSHGEMLKTLRDEGTAPGPGMVALLVNRPGPTGDEAIRSAPLANSEAMLRRRRELAAATSCNSLFQTEMPLACDR